MVSREALKRMVKMHPGRLLGLKSEREKLRRFYKQETGQEELYDSFRSSGLLSGTEPGAGLEYQLGARNTLIDRLERMGCLDEDNVKRLISYMVNELPILGTLELGLDEEESSEGKGE